MGFYIKIKLATCSLKRFSTKSVRVMKKFGNFNEALLRFPHSEFQRFPVRVAFKFESLKRPCAH